MDMYMDVFIWLIKPHNKPNVSQVGYLMYTLILREDAVLSKLPMLYIPFRQTTYTTQNN